jgi:hypothetical protein
MIINIIEFKIKLHAENVNVIRMKKIQKRVNKYQHKPISIIKTFTMIKVKK